MRLIGTRANDVENALRPLKPRHEVQNDEPRQTTEREDTGGQSGSTVGEFVVVGGQTPFGAESSPVYGMVELYPTHVELSEEQQQLKSEHDAARTELIERKPSTDTLEESHYPLCAKFMIKLVEYLVGIFP